MRKEMKEIVGRRKSDGKIVRDLICGHIQVQPSGGKAHLATHAKCKECLNPKPTQEQVHAA